jgi:hypothetical protein
MLSTHCSQHLEGTNTHVHVYNSITFKLMRARACTLCIHYRKAFLALLERRRSKARRAHQKKKQQQLDDLYSRRNGYSSNGSNGYIGDNVSVIDIDIEQDIAAVLKDSIPSNDSVYSDRA